MIEQIFEKKFNISVQQIDIDIMGKRRRTILNNYFKKYFCFIILISILFPAYSVLGYVADRENQSRHGDFFFSPNNVDFGKMLEGQTDKVIVSVWARVGCCVPPFDYESIWDVDWININPSSGSTMGEYDFLKLTIDTSDLLLGEYVEAVNVIGNFGQPAVLWVHVEVVKDTPIIKVEKVFGGFGQVNVKIKNTGDLQGDNINWGIWINKNSYQSEKYNSGNIEKIVDGSYDFIESKRFFGIGSFEITITTKANDLEETSKKSYGFIIGALVLIPIYNQ